MLRQTLLYLSRSRRLRQWMERSRTAEKVTSRFVAGQTLVDELRVIQKLSTEHLLATADFLGENVTAPEEALASRDTYLEALTKVQPFAATVSIKLTQFGLDFSMDDCLANVRPLVECARAYNSRVEIDMESSEYTDRTISVAERLQSEFGGSHLRVAIQAYLHRSAADIERLSAAGIPVRLCKGAYREPASVAFRSKAQVDDNYCKLTMALLDRAPYPAIASHDPSMLHAAVKHVREQNIPRDRFEFQMLYGIRRDLQRELVANGFRLRLYIPYGDAWFPYFMRRLAERPANVFFLLRNLVRR